jgi:hypothetical protein
LVIALGIGAVFGLRAQRQAAEKSARSDLTTGSRLLDEGKVGDGLAYLVSAASRKEATGVAATRILSTLTSHAFSLPVGPAVRLPGPTETVRILAGGTQALVQGVDGTLRLIDVANSKLLREYQFDGKIHPTGLRIAANNAEIFAVALVNGTVAVVETATGRLRFAPITPPARVEALNKQRDAAGRSAPTVSRTTEVKGGGERARREGTRGAAWEPTFSLSPDGRWLRTINDSWAIFDTATGEQRSAGDFYHRVDMNDPMFAAFTPDGTRFVTSSSRTLSV